MFYRAVVLPYFATQSKQLIIPAPADNAPPAVKFRPPPLKFLFAAAGFFRLHWRSFFTVLELDD